jgi:hypothetical protein
MATSSIYTEIFDVFCGIPKSTAMTVAQRIRADRDDPPLLRRGKQGVGALDLNAWEVANWIIALAAATATTRKCPDAIETVKLARATARLHEHDWDAQCPADAIEGLSIGSAETFGEAIDSLVNDMRSGAYLKWRGGPEGTATLGIRFFNNGGRIVINLRRFFKDGRSQGAVLVFRGENPADGPGMSLTFIHELNGDVLEELARALGPPG